MKVLIIAGEASADLHASMVIKELKKSVEVELVGVGGDRLSALGLKPIAHAKDMAVIGLTEALKKIPQSLRLLKELKLLAAKEKPDLAILVDLPDFNFRLAPALKKLAIPIAYYISPQVWAWRSGRVHQMANWADILLSIFPFEKAWFEKNAPSNLKVEYVGHPALEEIPSLDYLPEANTICLMPGSRENEMSSLLPLMLSAVEKILTQKPDLHFVLPVAEPMRDSLGLNNLLSHNKALIDRIGAKLSLVNEPAHTVLRKSKLAIVASGTATLEAAIVGTPMLVLYQVSSISAFIFKYFVDYKGPIAMANLIHKGVTSSERVVPELIQDELTEENIISSVLKFLDDQKYWQDTANTLAETKNILYHGSKTHSENVAEQLLATIRNNSNA